MLMEQRLDYVLTTGGNWALGTIGDFKLTIDKGDPENLVSFCGENVKKTGPTTLRDDGQGLLSGARPQDPDPASLRDGAGRADGRHARARQRQWPAAPTTGRASPDRADARKAARAELRLMDIAIYVAIAENGVIGRDNGLPWRLSTDMKRFKAGTMGKPVVMGRKTWESFPRRPLPGRPNIVISRDPAYRAEGAETVTSLEDALTLAKCEGRCLAGADEICIIGGGEIYRQAMRHRRPAPRHACAGKLGRRHAVSRNRPGNLARGRAPRSIPAGEKDTHATRYVVYERRRGDAKAG